MQPPSDPLDDLLDRWGPPPEPPPRLAAEVRRRLAAPPAPATAPWWERLDAVFARPSFAAAFVAAGVLLGLFLAEARLSRLHAERSARLARSYLQLIDPQLTPPPPAPPAASRS
jgi:hypothetical protein